MAFVLLLSRFAIPSAASTRVADSSRSQAKAEVDRIARQVGLWMLDQGCVRLPEDFHLRRLTGADPPYLETEALIDPWGNPYVFVPPNPRNPYICVISWGADGVLGGAGAAADVVNGRT